MNFEQNCADDQESSICHLNCLAISVIIILKKQESPPA